ncbi:phage protein Gp27 family protein [Comamonas flocculans]|uniref:DUF3486 family protein n=1 Tax=Comamonas flocculans TaxID=2597701 RepID=A0A5B8RZI5_9BURK|nr:phage protein Gp27 family protein [Comamonas flocculans]QEA14264.1 DUF3486 family protein [Comamonas flocculans]
MGRKSTVSRLPAEIKSYIEAMLATGAQTLDELIADLQARYPAESHAGQLPSRSALHRYGAKLDRRLAAIRASTEAAKLIQQHAGDDKDARSEALTAMVQSELFEAILALQEADEIGEDGEKADPGERVALLSKAAKNIATLTRSSINLKEFQARIEEATRKKLLAEQQANLEKIAKSQGMGREQVDFWIKEFLGVR